MKPRVLIFIAPMAGSGGVGDYAEDILDSVRGEFDIVEEVRTGAAKETKFADVIAYRHRVRRLERIHRDNVIVVHAELASGLIGPYWALGASRGENRTAVIHDSPQPVWYPFLSPLIGRHDLFNYLVHYPLRNILAILQRRALSGTKLFTLSAVGARKVESFIRHTGQVQPLSHYVPLPYPAEQTPLPKRPRAVGLYGHVYRSKGFQSIQEIRDLMNDDIEIIVAGRGTEILPSIPGVRILGEIDGLAEFEFFDSIRALLLPYDRHTRFGTVYSASGAMARAFSYCTPAISSSSEVFIEESRKHGCTIAVSGELTEMVSAVEDLVNSTSALKSMELKIAELRSQRAVSNAIAELTATWRTMCER